MMVSRKGIRRRLRRGGTSRGKRSNRLSEATRQVREESDQVAKRERERTRAERAERRRRQAEHFRARTESFTARVRGAWLEARRRIGPLLAPIGAGIVATLRRIAPTVSRILIFVVRIPLALVALLLDSALDAGRWVRGRAAPALAGAAAWTTKNVTPLRTVATVAGLAAIALAVSQFINYRGIAVGIDLYEGEVGTVAEVPRRGLETAGSAHFYVMIPLAVLALVLIRLTMKGRWRLGRAVSLIGAIGIAISLLVDAPQGLDAGNAGAAYEGTEAQLIEGFWAQLTASIVLLGTGPLLSRYAKRTPGAIERDTRAKRRAQRERERQERRGGLKGSPGSEARA